mmetsp:Transcript_2934/g.13088  ORF Transcript_2934/g.13088 Transcript_2934/m.13088 type:complete len:344 (+) Transcript_2934:752-1783(+)
MLVSSTGRRRGVCPFGMRFVRVRRGSDVAAAVCSAADQTQLDHVPPLVPHGSERKLPEPALELRVVLDGPPPATVLRDPAPQRLHHLLGPLDSPARLGAELALLGPAPSRRLRLRVPGAVVHELDLPGVDVESIAALTSQLVLAPGALEVLVELVVVDEVVVHVVPLFDVIRPALLLLGLFGSLGRGSHGSLALLLLDDGRVVRVAPVVDHVLLAVGFGGGVLDAVVGVVVLLLLVGILEARRGVEALDAADDLRHVVPRAARELVLGARGSTAGGRGTAAHARVDGCVRREGIVVVAAARRGGSAGAAAPGVRILLELLVIYDGHRIRVQVQRDVQAPGRGG